MLELILNRRFSFVLISVCFFVGCGSGANDAPVRRVVEGMVLYQNLPLERGTIRFLPQPNGPVASAVIIDGSYRVENKGGVLLGKQRVEITASEAGSDLVEAEVMPDENRETAAIIPPKYNVESSIEAVVESGQGVQVLDFSLD